MSYCIEQHIENKTVSTYLHLHEYVMLDDLSKLIQNPFLLLLFFMLHNHLHVFDFSEAAPVFVKKLKDQKIRDGDTVILTCSVEGQPRPQITWSRNGVEILDNQVSQPPPPACGGMCDVEVTWSYKNPEFTKTHEHVKY